MCSEYIFFGWREHMYQLSRRSNLEGQLDGLRQLSGWPDLDVWQKLRVLPFRLYKQLGPHVLSDLRPGDVLDQGAGILPAVPSRYRAAQLWAEHLSILYTGILSAQHWPDVLYRLSGECPLGCCREDSGS